MMRPTFTEGELVEVKIISRGGEWEPARYVDRHPFGSYRVRVGRIIWLVDKDSIRKPVGKEGR